MDPQLAEALAQNEGLRRNVKALTVEVDRLQRELAEAKRKLANADFLIRNAAR